MFKPQKTKTSYLLLIKWSIAFIEIFKLYSFEYSMDNQFTITKTTTEWFMATHLVKKYLPTKITVSWFIHVAKWVRCFIIVSSSNKFELN